MPESTIAVDALVAGVHCILDSILPLPPWDANDLVSIICSKE